MDIKIKLVGPTTYKDLCNSKGTQEAAKDRYYTFEDILTSKKLFSDELRCCSGAGIVSEVNDNKATFAHLIPIPENIVQFDRVERILKSEAGIPEQNINESKFKGLLVGGVSKRERELCNEYNHLHNCEVLFETISNFFKKTIPHSIIWGQEGYEAETNIFYKDKTWYLNNERCSDNMTFKDGCRIFEDSYEKISLAKGDSLYVNDQPITGKHLKKLLNPSTIDRFKRLIRYYT